MNTAQRRGLLSLLVILVFIAVVLLDLLALGISAADEGDGTYPDSDASGVSGEQSPDPVIISSDHVTGTGEPTVTSDDTDTTEPPVMTEEKVTTTSTAKVTTTTTKATTTTTAKVTTAATTWHIVKEASVSATGPKLSPSTNNADPETTTATKVIVTTGLTTSGTASVVSSSEGDDENKSADPDGDSVRSLVTERALIVTGVVLAVTAVIAIVFTLIFGKKDA